MCCLMPSALATDPTPHPPAMTVLPGDDRVLPSDGAPRPGAAPVAPPPPHMCPLGRRWTRLRTGPTGSPADRPWQGAEAAPPAKEGLWELLRGPKAKRNQWL